VKLISLRMACCCYIRPSPSMGLHLIVTRTHLRIYIMNDMEHRGPGFKIHLYDMVPDVAVGMDALPGGK